MITVAANQKVSAVGSQNTDCNGEVGSERCFVFWQTEFLEVDTNENPGNHLAVVTN